MLRRNALFLMLVLVAMFSCNKEKEGRITSKVGVPTTKPVKTIATERSLCCGSITVRMYNPTDRLPWAFVIHYLDNTGTWQSTSCIPNGTTSYTVNACHERGTSLLILLTECSGTGTPLSNNYPDIAISYVDACSVTHWNSVSPCSSFAYGNVTLPVAFQGSTSFYGYSYEGSLCCD